MEIWIFETEDWERKACSLLSASHEVVCKNEPLNFSNAATAASAECVTTFVHSRLTTQVLQQMPKLRMIATRSTGYDHIDMGYAREHGITVCNIPDYGNHTVAEHSFALLLALARHIPEAALRTRHADFSQDGTCGFDLLGKTFGVIGAGRIGKRAIGIARGFGMSVLAHDPVADSSLAKRLGYSYVDFDMLLSEADIVSLHVPASATTENMMSDGQFSRMKKGSILINTSRGNVVDTAALVRALSACHIGAAGLDVLPEELFVRDEAQIFRNDPNSLTPDYRALVANHVLMSLPNVIVTPHIAYNTHEARARIVEATLRNIEAFTRGKPVNVLA